MSAAGTPKASEAAIAAVHNALRPILREHAAVLPDVRPWCMCGHKVSTIADREVHLRDALAVAAADAAAPWIAAQTLENTVRAWQSGEGFTVMAPKGVGIPAIDYAQRALDWLRAGADQIGAGQ